LLAVEARGAAKVSMMPNKKLGRYSATPKK
jgi:hypothetical protein